MLNHTDHPHLLLREGDRDELRARSVRSPWKEWRELALASAPTLVDQPELDPRDRAEHLAYALSVNALAHLLDPEDLSHRSRIVSMIEAFDETSSSSVTSTMRANPDKMLWIHAVPTGNAFVHAVLALDLIVAELEADEALRLESVLRRGPARYFRDTPLAWHQGTLAAAAIWPLYEHEDVTVEPLVTRWWSDAYAAISPDGVFRGGTGYAIARWTSPDREHKAFFGEILARAGWLPDWYQEPRLGLFQEWLYGYANTPSRIAWTVGDSSPTPYKTQDHTGAERAYRYSELAGRYAARLTRGVPTPPRLSTYVLTDAPASIPAAAPSRVFPDGGAWLKETSDDENSLAAALLNQRHSTDAHAHKETNAVVLAAYGELLLRGGGYSGWETGEDGFTWDYIHDRAIAASTVLLDSPVPTSADEERSPRETGDHVSRAGAGITASLLTGRIDAAEGHSGAALSNGTHRRVLVFIHPHDGALGYYATFDEVTGDASTAQVVWHPASNRHEESVPGLVHTWTKTEHVPAGVSLSVVLATPASKTTLHDGMAASWDHGCLGRYLVGHYEVDADEATSVLTALIPHDDEHTRPEIERMTKDGAQGIVVHHEAVDDLLLTCIPGQEVTVHEGVSLRAEGCFIRLRNDEVAEIWAHAATEIRTDGLLVQSDHPVLVHKRGARLAVATRTSTLIRLTSTNGAPIDNVIVDGTPAPKTAEAAAEWSLPLTAGEHSLHLIHDLQP